VGVPGVLSKKCADGSCCAAFRRDLIAPLPPGLRAVAIHSRSDGIVDWRACLDRHAERIEVSSSHVGMAVNTEVYRLLERVVVATPNGARRESARIRPLTATEATNKEQRWNG
jgi:hypothetical protein